MVEKKTKILNLKIFRIKIKNIETFKLKNRTWETKNLVKNFSIKVLFKTSNKEDKL